MSAAELVRRSRASQDLPPKVSDAGVIARIVALLLTRGSRREEK